MKKFVLALNFLLSSTIAYGQDTTLDQGSYIYEANQPLYNLVDTTQWDPNTIIWTTASDDDGTQINLNFDWERWGQTFDTAWQSSNGCLSFTGICYGFNAGENGYIQNTLYPLWTDLIAAGNGENPSKMAYYGDNEKMIFGWYNMWEFYRESNNSFEVILWADSSYEYRYGSLDILNHNVYIGEEGNNNQEGGKTLNTYLYFNRYASGVNYGLDQHLTNIGITLEGASLYAEANTYRFDDYVPPDDNTDPPPVDPCESDPQSSPNCPGYQEPYNQVDDLTELYAGTDLIFGDEPSDFYGLNANTDYGDNTEELLSASVNYGEDSFDFGESSIDYGTVSTTNDAESDFIDMGVIDTDNTLILAEQTGDVVEDTGEEQFDESLGYTDPNIYDSDDIIDDVLIADAIDDEIDLLTGEEEILEESSEIVVLEDTEELAVVDNLRTPEDERGREEIQKALEILSSLDATKSNPAFSVPGSTDPVNIAISTVNAEKQLIQDLVTDEFLSQLEEIEQKEDTQSQQSNGEELLANNKDNADTSSGNSSKDTSAEESYNYGTIVDSNDTLNNSNMITSSSNNGYMDSNESFTTSVDEEVLVSNDEETTEFLSGSFESSDLAFQTDPTMIVDATIEILADSYTQSEDSTNNELVDELLTNTSTSVDATSNPQFEQLLATGATTIGELVSGEQPDYTKFDIKPLPQEDQLVVAKAESQLETLSSNDVKNNLDDYTKELQESGGFNSNAQTLTMLLMARVQGYNYGSITLADRATFYAPKNMYTTNRIGDNNNNLRLLLTDDKHRQLVDLQYE